MWEDPTEECKLNGGSKDALQTQTIQNIGDMIQSFQIF